MVKSNDKIYYVITSKSETFFIEKGHFLNKVSMMDGRSHGRILAEFSIHYRLDSSLTSFLLRYGGDGSVYVGSFRYGRSSGPAVMTYASGDIATGAVSDAF